jgi:hypothetical protein
MVGEGLVPSFSLVPARFLSSAIRMGYPFSPNGRTRQHGYPKGHPYEYVVIVGFHVVEREGGHKTLPYDDCSNGSRNP